MHVQFASPIIGPREYVSTNSSSGWPEVFKRDACDATLAEFLKPLKLEEVLNNFLVQQYAIRSKHRAHKTSWGDVTAYLSRLKGCTPGDISGELGVGFWARSLICEREDLARKAG